MQSYRIIHLIKTFVGRVSMLMLTCCFSISNPIFQEPSHVYVMFFDCHLQALHRFPMSNSTALQQHLRNFGTWSSCKLEGCRTILSCMSTFALASINTFAISESPVMAAELSAVQPSSFCTSIFAPTSTNNFAISLFPLLTAKWSVVQPFWSPWMWDPN